MPILIHRAGVARALAGKSDLSRYLGRKSDSDPARAFPLPENDAQLRFRHRVNHTVPHICRSQQIE